MYKIPKFISVVMHKIPHFFNHKITGNLQYVQLLLHLFINNSLAI